MLYFQHDSLKIQLIYKIKFFQTYKFYKNKNLTKFWPKTSPYIR